MRKDPNMSLSTLHALSSLRWGSVGRFVEKVALLARHDWRDRGASDFADRPRRSVLQVRLTRWDGFLSLSPSTAFLFENMFKLHIFGGEYPFPMPIVVAHLVGMAEITLPILLVLGLGTRFVAFGLLTVTGIIQLTVPEGWANFHLP
jgi:putative oxidoreductase